jgi:hypothetical protein
MSILLERVFVQGLLLHKLEAHAFLL